MGRGNVADEGEAASSLNGSAFRACQELWFALARRHWDSIVLVPVGSYAAATQIGKSLAELGTKLSETPVMAMSVTSLKTESAFVLADLQQQLRRMRRPAHVDRSPVINVTPHAATEAEVSGGPMPTAQPGDKLAQMPASRLVISIPPVTSEPLGLAATQNADAIVLVVEVGRTRIADARRTIELIGRQRIAGCVTVS